MLKAWVTYKILDIMKILSDALYKYGLFGLLLKIADLMWVMFWVIVTIVALIVIYNKFKNKRKEDKK